jgi:tetratricopeptide (TPR) repeat protein
MYNQQTLNMKQIISLSILISIMSAGCGNKAQKLSQAQEVFRQGIELTSTGSVPDMLKAKELVRQSVKIDSTFAPGYAQIAITNASLAGDWNYLSPEKAYPEAITDSDRSIALDENLAAGYLAKALIEQHHYWNLSEAEAYYEKGIALDPANVELIIKSAWLKYLISKQAEAQEMIEKAGKLDPDSPGFRSFLVFDLVYSERFDEARKHIMNDINANPDDPYSY